MARVAKTKRPARPAEGPIPVELTDEEKDKARARVLVMRGPRWIEATRKAHALIAEIDAAIERGCDPATKRDALVAMAVRIEKAWAAWHSRSADGDALRDLANVVESFAKLDVPPGLDVHVSQYIDPDSARAMLAQSAHAARYRTATSHRHTEPRFACACLAPWRAAIERARTGGKGKRNGGPGKWETLTALAIELGVVDEGTDAATVKRKVDRWRAHDRAPKG